MEVFGVGAWGWVGLRGIGPALAGNVGAGSAFALSHAGDFGFDVPVLAAARFRCHGRRSVGANFLGQLSGLKTGNDGVSFAT